jgi:hypothetical protein
MENIMTITLRGLGKKYVSLRAAPEDLANTLKTAPQRAACAVYENFGVDLDNRDSIFDHHSFMPVLDREAAFARGRKERQAARLAKHYDLKI